MFREWIAPDTVDQFVATCLHRQAIARPYAAAKAVPLLTWERLDSILRAGPALKLLVVARGEQLDVPAPTDLASARALMARGWGFVIRRGERHDPGLAALAEAFARDLDGEVNLHLFVTPGGTHGFGWHYDFEDVFIVQTAGIKDYYFRQNTVDTKTPRGRQPDFTVCRRETTPLATARLTPGDWLYIPSRWWHMAKCTEDSLSISIGIYPRRAPVHDGV